MANQEHLDILKQGVKAWNQWRQEHPKIQPDLSRAHLQEADLPGANLTWVYLHGTNLVRSNLTGAQLIEAQLHDADLYGACLVAANLTGAYLSRTNLSRADLRRADFSKVSLKEVNFVGSNLDETNLTKAFMVRVIFGESDFRKVKGLDTVRHRGPSVISLDILYRSQGAIPDIFLRGAGIPEALIEYARSLIFKPIDYYTCFISYSSKDQSFAERLHADLQNKGVRCWFAPEDMKIGDKMRVRIDESIRLYDKLLLVLSEHSVNSQWIEQEVETALAKEREGQLHVLFPIRLDETVMHMRGGWPALIRNMRHIGDFTKWKQHDDYQQAFERLLRDLKAETQ